MQIVPLHERIRTYSGNVAFRQLQGVNLDDNDMSALLRLRHDLKGRRYEQSVIELIKAAYDGPLGKNIEDLSSLFCSEMVAEGYQTLRLLKNSVPSNEYTPADFGEDRNITLLRGWLGSEISLEVE